MYIYIYTYIWAPQRMFLRKMTQNIQKLYKPYNHFRTLSSFLGHSQFKNLPTSEALQSSAVARRVIVSCQKKKQLDFQIRITSRTSA